MRGLITGQTKPSIILEALIDRYGSSFLDVKIREKSLKLDTEFLVDVTGGKSVLENALKSVQENKKKTVQTALLAGSYLIASFVLSILALGI